MTVFRAPALDKAAPIVDPRTGRITPYFQRFWQNLGFTADTGANSTSDITALQSQVTTINGQITTLNSQMAGKAPLADPAFTGNPTAPTPTAGDNDTSIATTAFVTNALTPKAPLASPTFTGTPAAPTAAQGTNTTQLATTAFVHTESVARATFSTWAAPTGTVARTTFATYAAPTASATYDQTQVQALMNAVQDVSQRLAALITDLKV